MDRRRAAGLLLALATCIATATAAPTASNHTALDLYDGSPDGCYYNFQHYGEGDRIMTNEPCLNCTCHNRMLMCYLRVCPFTKPIGQDCTIEKRADQCCPIVTCPDVPVDLLTSTTTSPAEYGPTSIGKLDRFGCSINGKYFSEGSKVPPTPNKPCEHCYCIRNMTTCVMQECTLHVDGCTPIYHKDVCCPVRYSCDHPEDEMPLLDDLSTTVRPTPGFLLTTTTISPVTQISQDCIYDNRVFADGASIKTEKACDHCYCMKGDIVCVVQECGTPMENEGKNCTALAPREGVCCPDTYICEGDESTTGTYETYDFTTHAAQEERTTLLPPRRTSSEGSGYRNEPDEIPYTESPSFEPEIEGSGEEEEPKQPTVIKPDSTASPGFSDDILEITEATHEYIPISTTKPTEEDRTTAEVGKEVESMISSSGLEKSSESQQNLPSTTIAYVVKDEEPITEKTQVQDFGSGEIPEVESVKPLANIPMTTVLPVIEKSEMTTETNKQDIITPGVTERELSESQMPITNVPIIEEETTKEPIEQALVTSDIGDKITSNLPTEHKTITLNLDENVKSTESSQVSAEIDTEGPETETQATATSSVPTIGKEDEETTDSAKQDEITSVSNEFNRDDNIDPQDYKTSTSSPSLDDEFITTESQEHEPATESLKETEFLVPQQHVTASTPMLEEIEKDTTEYNKPERIVPSDATLGDTSYVTSSTIAYIEKYEKDVTKSTIPEEHLTEDHVLGTSDIPVYDQQEITTEEPHKIPEMMTSHLNETDIKENSEPEQYSPSTSAPAADNNGRRTTSPDFEITISEHDTKPYDFGSSTTTSVLESEEATTEPDKGLNTIPSGSIEEGPVSSEEQKTTAADEKMTTESGLYTKLNVDADFITIPSKQTTISSDTSVSIEESSTLTTELASRKEDYTPTESQTSPELTTVAAGVTKEVISTLTHDHTKSTESILDVKQESYTTSEPKYTENIEESTLAKKSTDVASYESSTPVISVSEKDLISEKESTTYEPIHENLPDTSVKQKDNEISNEPRIPGEGDCLLNGITYTNESAVPSANKCQSGCKCISSIIKCDPIICSPPPEYMNNCEVMYDTSEACCPTYICDHKTETIPPQSHSQMSGTEAPVTSHVHCHGDECEIAEDKKQHEVPSDACKTGNCIGSPDESQDTVSYPPAENIPEQPTTDQKVECVGDKCTPVLCTEENNCQTSPVTPCEGKKCEKIPEIISHNEPCMDGEDCTVPKVPFKECTAGNCGSTDTQLGDIYPKEPCTDKEGCQNIPNVFDKECTEENCDRKDSSSVDQKVPVLCTEPDCKQTQKDIESSTPSVLVITPQENVDRDDTKETSVIVPETTEKLESSTEPSQHIHSYGPSELPGAHEMVTEKQPEIVSDHRTKSESESEITTKPVEFTYQQEVTSSEYATDNAKPELTEEPGYLIPVSTDTNIKENEINIPSVDEISTGIPDTSVISEDDIYTDDHVMTTVRPQIIETKVTTKPEIGLEKETTTKIFEDSSTEPSKTYTSETTEVTKSHVKLEPEDVTQIISEETSTVPSKLLTTSKYNEITKPFDEIEHDDTTNKGVTKESTTESIKTDDIKSEEDSKLPELVEHAETTTTFTQESNTEPTKMYSTESQDITRSPSGMTPEDITQKSSEENITKPPKSSDDTTQGDFTKQVSVESGTEPTKSFEPEEQTGKVDHVVTPSKPLEDSNATTPEEIEQDSTTMKIVEEIGSESPTSSSIESEDMTKSPKEKEHKDTPSINIEETGTESSNTYVTESPDITKSSDQLDHEVTSIKILEEPSTESSISDSTDHEITISPQGSLDEDIATKFSDESSTIPPNKYTELEKVTKSSEDIEHEDITIYSEGTSTEPSQFYVTEAKYPTGEEYHDDVTSKILEESSTELSKTTMKEHEHTKSPEKPSYEDNTTKVSEAIYPVVKDPQEIPEPPEQVDKKYTTSKILEESVTEPPKMHSTEQQEISKSEEMDNERTTMNILEEYSTAQPMTIETETQVPELPEIEDQKDSTSKILETPITETSITLEAQHLLTTPEGLSTSIKDKDESATEQSKTPNEYEHVLPVQPVTESDSEIETIKPTIVETPTEKPKTDEEKLSVETETAQKMTTASALFTSELIELTTPSLIPDSKKTEPELTKLEETTSGTIDDMTQSVKEQLSSTTPVTTDYDISITMFPVTNDANLEIHTTLSPSDELEEVSNPDLHETLSSQKPDFSTVPVQTATEEVPAITATDDDELRTTLSKIEELITPKPVEATQAPHDVEIKTDYPEISDKSQEEPHTENISSVSQQVTTEEISADTEQPAKQPAKSEDEIKTEKPVTVLETDVVKGTESEIETQQTSSEGKPLSQEERYTEEPVSKYSSPAPTIVYDSTKSSDEDVDDTTELRFHELSKPQTTIDALSLVTEQYESTIPNLETDSETLIPVQISSATPESGMTGQDIVKEKITTPSTSSIIESDKSELVTSTEYAKPGKEEIITETQSSEITTEKEHLREESTIGVQPTVPEKDKTTTISEHKFTTEHSDIIQTIKVTTGTVPPDTSYTKIQESVTTDKSLVEMHKLTTESSTTEASESEQEPTKSPEVQIEEQKEPSEDIPASSTEAPTLETVVKTESSSVEPTIASQHEYSESTISPSVEYADKILDENAATSLGEQLTTESGHSPIYSEVYTEKQPETETEIIQTVTSEKAIPIEEFLTTRKQLEPGVYQTTLSVIDDIPEISTRLPESEEEAVEHTSPKEEQTMPDKILETEKISPSDKPIQKTTAPEEEFIVATSEVTTKVEEEISISTLSPTADSNTRPTDAESHDTSVPETSVTTDAEVPVTRTPEVPVTTMPEAPVTTVVEKFTTTEAEAPVTKTAEAPITAFPVSSVTTEAEAPITRTPDVPFTTMPEAPVTTAFETLITTEAEALITKIAEAPITASSETPVTTESEGLVTKLSEVPVTTAPEIPVTKLPEGPDTTSSEESVTTAPKAPVTSLHETPITKMPEAHVTSAPESTITTASEVPSITVPEAPISSAPEASITTASEAPAITAPEAPITSAPELPKPISTEMQPTDEVSTHDEEGSFPPSSGTSGYGPEPDYVDEDQTFGPGTCRYGGKVYVSAQQIPRDDPCDFCFCFRSDIICLQQSCPPPIHGCHEEPIQGFCCPRYECPVSMATSVNVTTTTTTTTTTLPPHFPTHSYKGSVQKRGCQIKGQTYKVGEVVRASSGPCLHCTCGGDGQMKCDPKQCTPEPMLRQMIAAAVSAKRRR